MTIQAFNTSADATNDVTIIIATLGLTTRRKSLERAIRSLQGCNKTTVQILVVVNGNRFDPLLVEELRHRSDIQVVQIETGSLSEAILTGRNMVETPFFGFLDDDDEYLPRALDIRLDAMRKNPAASIVITNGFHHINDVDHFSMNNLANVEDDPLSALFNENWLASCGGLYRTSHLPSALFEDIARYLEWTWLAFRITSLNKRVVAVDQPTFRIYDTAESESKSDEYLFSRIAILKRMRSTCNNKQIRKKILSKMAQTWHEISCVNLQSGKLTDAWTAHLWSLGYQSGLKYLTYTRHLLFPRKR